jgi:hypothetical protein
MSNTTIQSPWTGTNVYLQLILLLASIFGGITQDTAAFVVAAGAGIVGAIGAIRTWVVQAKLTSPKSWIADPNNWTYLTAALTAIIPAASGIVQPLKGVAEALVTGNWGAVITAGFALFSYVFYTWIKK